MAPASRRGRENQSFGVWSSFKRRVYHHRGPRLLFSFLSLAALVTALLLLNRKSLPPAAVLGGFVFLSMALTALVVGALGDVFDTTRHQLVFFEQCDMLLLAVIWLTARALRSEPQLLRSGLREHVLTADDAR